VQVAGVFAAVALMGACHEIARPSPEDAAKAALVRTDEERAVFLAEYQKGKQERARKYGEDPNRFEDADALAATPEFEAAWRLEKPERHQKFHARYQSASADQVKCVIQAAKAEEPSQVRTKMEDCTNRPPKEELNVVTTAGLLALLAGLMILGVALFRSVERKNDPVQQACKRLGFAYAQSPGGRVMEGDHKGRNLRIEASPPEEADTHISIVVRTGLDPNVQARLGPVAPPTGVELVDIDAPAVEDDRIPEGYMLALSAGLAPDSLLDPTTRFHIESFDPLDIRVRDGQLCLSRWDISDDPAQIVTLADFAVNLANQFPKKA